MKRIISASLFIIIVLSLGTAVQKQSPNVNSVAVDMIVEDIDHKERIVDISLPSDQSGSDVEATWSDSTKTATVDGEGKASINLETPLPSGTVITFTLKNSPTDATATVSKTVQWTSLVTSIISNKTRYVTVTTAPSEVGSTIYAEWNCMIAVGTVKSDGKAQIDLGGEPISAGTNVTFSSDNLLFTTSPSLNKTVGWSTISLSFINPSTRKVTVTTSPAEEGGKAYVKWGSTLRSATVTSSGKAIVNLGTSIRSGTNVQAYIISQSGSKSPTIQRKVALPTPAINAVTTGSTVITGKAIPSTTAYVTVGSRTVKVNVDSKGTFSVRIAKQKVGTSLSTYVIDRTSNRSAVLRTKVILPTPFVNKVTTKSTVIRGKATPNTTAHIEINSKTYTRTVNSTGDYTMSISKKKLGTTVSVYVKDKKGNYSLKNSIRVTNR